MDLNEIKGWITYQKDIRHAKRIVELKKDIDFFNDNYERPYVRDEKYIVKTGFVASMINNITQQLVTNRPRVFTVPKNDKREAAAKRVSSVCNRQMGAFSTYPDNPFDITFKRNFMGESWVYIPFMSDIAKNKDTEWRDTKDVIIPCHFIFPDPMVVYSDPSEEVDGIPSRVCISFETNVADIFASYPGWKGKGGYKDKDKVTYLFYMSNTESYAEADGYPLFMDIEGKILNGDGVRKNILGFVPFVHSYSGWGYANETRDPDMMAYSRVRMIRDKIVMDSTIASDFQKNIHEYAWKHRVIRVPQGSDFDAETALGEYQPDEEGAVSVLKLPQGGDMGIEESKLFSGEVFAYRNQLRNDLSNEFPQVLQGNDLGTSGRNLDVAGYLGLTLYDCCINNVQNMWAKALNMSLKICDKLGIMPKGTNAGDSESYSELTVDLKKVSPNELSRRQSEAAQDYAAGRITLHRYLVDGRQMTDEEADNEETEILATNIMNKHPFFADLAAQTMARSQGVGEQFEAWKAQMNGAGEGIKPVINYGAQGGEPRQGNIKTAIGMEQAGMGGHERRVGAE